ncbi:MAG: porin [Rubrivivax sp.]
MNHKHLIAVAAALVAGSAFAQGTEIYGRINLSLERQDVAGTKKTVVQDNASRIGFRGTEDLGGGLKAGFVIEHGFNADTGSANTGGNHVGGFWGRESTLSLSGSFGTVRLGNMPASEAYFATADYVSMHNHDTGTSSDALYGFAATGQLTSAIAYTSPTMGGLRLDIQYGFKEGTRPDAPMAIAANYDAGPLHLGFGYEEFDGAKSTAVRALYELGAFTVGGYYEKGSGDLRYNNFRLAGMYTMGASEFHVNYGRRGDTNGVDGTDRNQFTLGYNYNLSKRTKVYAFYTKLGGAADFNSLALGMRHNF